MIKMSSELITADSILYGAAGMAVGTGVGWVLKKTVTIIFKLLMVIAVIFVTALIYLEHIRVIAINERALDNLLNAGYNQMNQTIGTDFNPITHIASSLGIPMSSGLVLGMIVGWSKG